MVFIHQGSFHVPAAETCFRATLKGGENPNIASPGLLRYFELRQAWDLKEYEKVGSEELVFLNQARKKYSGSRYESLYEEWTNRTRTDSVMTEIMSGNEVRSEFLPYQINVDPKTFMVTKMPKTGDQPTKSCFHPLRHPLCHPVAGAMNRDGET